MVCGLLYIILFLYEMWANVWYVGCCTICDFCMVCGLFYIVGCFIVCGLSYFM